VVTFGGEEGRIRKEREGKEKGGCGKEGERIGCRKGGLRLPSLKCGFPETSLAGYVPTLEYKVKP